MADTNEELRKLQEKILGPKQAEENVGRLFGGLFPDAGMPKAPPPKQEKGVAWAAKVIDGQYYVPLAQVAELLRQNEVLRQVAAGIERRVEKGPPV